MSRPMATILTHFGRGPSSRSAERRRPAHPLGMEPLEVRPLMASIVPLNGLAPAAINSAGQVAGTTAPPSGAGNNAALYSNGGVTDLGTLGGSQAFSYGEGLNDAGQVVGASGTTNSTLGLPYHAFLYNGEKPLADLGTLPGKKDSYAHGINTSGQIVGDSSNSGLDDDSGHAFLYSGGQMIDLGTLNGGKNDTSHAAAINDSGDVVGWSLTIASPSGFTHAFLYDGAMHDLGTLPGYSASYAVAINASDQVVGYSAGNGLDRAFFDSGGTMTELGTLPGDTQSDAYALNDAGQVVGASFNTRSDSHAFLYSGGQMIDLDTLLPAGSGWTLQDARGINDKGQIVGFGTHDGVSEQGYLLDLGGTPSPSSVEIDINDTASNADNITLFNPPSTGEPASQTIPARITNTGTTAATFQLSVQPSSAATLLDSSGNPITSVNLQPGVPIKVTIKPTADSSAPNDVHLIVTQGGVQVGEDSMTIVGVTFGPTEGTNSLDIKNQDTPDGMPDRIPPRVNTPEYINIMPNLADSNQSVVLTVDGQSAENGTVTIDGMSGVELQSSGTMSLSSPSGDTQTMPGHSGNLLTTILVRGVGILQSSGFSVSAIPVNFVESYSKKKLTDKGYIGYKVNVTWSSDSNLQNNTNDNGDLDDVMLLEAINSLASGSFAGVDFETQTVPFSANISGGMDEQSTPRKVLKHNGGILIIDQVYLFSDARTGADYYAVPNAAYVITYKVTPVRHKHLWNVTITDKGMHTTVAFRPPGASESSQFQSDAGKGYTSKVFKIK